MATKAKSTTSITVSQATIANLQAELAQQQTIANNNIALASYFATAQMNIDQRILSTPFKGNVKNSFLWVVANWRELVMLVQYIVSVVKQVREKLEDLKKTATTPVTANA